MIIEYDILMRIPSCLKMNLLFLSYFLEFYVVKVEIFTFYARGSKASRRILNVILEEASSLIGLPSKISSMTFRLVLILRMKNQYTLQRFHNNILPLENPQMLTKSFKKLRYAHIVCEITLPL